MSSAIHKLYSQLPASIVQHIQYLERIRQDFVANVSHELRTPLTVVHGYLELLLDQDLEETKPWKKIFTQMQQQTQRMERLIEDLLLLSRLENDETIQVKEKSINVTAMLNYIIEEAKTLSGEAKHCFHLTADENLQLMGHEDELRSLFSNIIFNAVKYTPAHGNIRIDWLNQQNHACFKVTDTGIGIAGEHLSKLTERFYRVDPARSRTSGGTGLGLAIVKHVLIRHGGKLQISSEPGKGSTFTCIFARKTTVII